MISNFIAEFCASRHRRPVDLVAPLMVAFIAAAGVPAVQAATAITVTSITVTPATLVGGTAISATITLSDVAPTAGEVVTLSVPTTDTAYLTLPVSVTFPAGTQTESITTIPTVAVNVNVAIPITATLGTSTAEATLTLLNANGMVYNGNLQFMSVPFYYKDILTDVFTTEPASGDLVRWNPAGTPPGYGVQGDPDLVTIVPGYGYWTEFQPTGTSLAYIGVPASSTLNTTITLQAGWNSIGNPFAVPINIADLTFTSHNYSFALATSPTYSLISPTLYFFLQDPSGFTGTYAPATSVDILAPGEGYWIYAYNITTLNYPPPLVPVTTTTTTTTTSTNTFTARHAY